MKKDKRWTSDKIDDQSGRVAIVTGANSGIGLETARELARKGATTILACRSTEKGDTAAEEIRADARGAKVEVMALDLASLDSVKAFAPDFLARFDRLDLLVNNAGVMMPPYSKTADGFELQFGTNHIGHFALTGLLLERLIATDGSRIVNVSSTAHKFGKIDFDDLNWERRRYKKMASYGQSKLANLLFTYELQRRLEQTGAPTIAVAAHPGWTGTNLQRNNGFFRAMNPLFSMRPWQGALPTLYGAVADEARGGEYYGPHGFMEMKGFPKAVKSTPASHDRDAQRRLWEISEEMSGVRFDSLAGVAAAA